MSKFVKFLVFGHFLFQMGKSYKTLNFLDGQLYIPFFDYLWKFDKDCQVRCHYFSIRCFFPSSPLSVCRDLRFMHQCCEQFSSTTTSTSTTTTTTSTTTTSTEDPLVELCTPRPPEMCQPEPGCSLSPHYSFWNKWSRQSGCEHKCWEHCSDPCACKTAANGNCEYHPSTGMCMARGKCEQVSFNEGECRRANSFYSIGGLLCHNRESFETNCENGSRIFAVNVNGEPHTDKRDIFYMADDSAFYEDKYNTRMDGNEGNEQLEGDDKNLYGSYAFGEGNGRDQGQCLYYSIKVEQDGNYEVALRTLEPQYMRAGERIFSLTLNQVPIALHVDLHALSYSAFTPVDIIANFNLETHSGKRVIKVKGHQSMDFEGNVQIGLCISDCRLCEEYNHLDSGYVASGLSLIRF